jgi:hypothetical protein
MKTLPMAGALFLAFWTAVSAEQPAAPATPKPPSKEEREKVYAKVYHNFPKLNKGMTKEEVAALIGYPELNKETDVWEWEFKNTGMADLEEYRIEFKNGRLVDKQSAGTHYSRRGEGL